jgi:hypothetical protein
LKGAWFVSTLETMNLYSGKSGFKVCFHKCNVLCRYVLERLMISSDQFEVGLYKLMNAV